MGILEAQQLGQVCALGMRGTGGGARNLSARTLHLSPTPDRRRPFSPPPPYIHTPASQLPLVLPWSDWEAWPPVSTQPRLDSDHLLHLPPPLPALPLGEEVLWKA